MDAACPAPIYGIYRTKLDVGPDYQIPPAIVRSTLDGSP